MRRYSLALLALAALPVAARAAPAERDVKALAAEIDRLLAARWEKEKVTPAADAGDGEFLRRASLDLLGRTPSITEVRDFLDDPAPDKRFQLVMRLTREDRHASHLAAVWRAVMIRSTGDPFRNFGQPFEAWLAQRFKDGTPYDQIVRKLVTGDPRDQGVQLFNAAAGQQPPELAAATSRVFLGLKIECAQCHNHPFDKWTREQFWGMAAFFAPNGGKEITIDGTTKKVKARFADGSGPETGGRAELAQWMTAGDNPYFARNAVNRMWEYFYGTGLTDPVDEGRADNPPSHPELLDLLAKEFVAQKFDLGYLVRALTATRAYGLSSTRTDDGQKDPRLFARMVPRGLSAEQLYDSILQVVGPDGLAAAPAAPGRFPNQGQLTARAEFLAKFPPQERRTEVQTSILQALHLMNGKFMADVTDPARNRTLATIIESRRPTRRKIDELYMVTLNRKPTDDERARLVKYVEGGGPDHDTKKAFADVLWALLNSSEFFLNH